MRIVPPHCRNGLPIECVGQAITFLVAARIFFPSSICNFGQSITTFACLSKWAAGLSLGAKRPFSKENGGPPNGGAQLFPSLLRREAAERANLIFACAVDGGPPLVGAGNAQMHPANFSRACPEWVTRKEGPASNTHSAPTASGPRTRHKCHQRRIRHYKCQKSLSYIVISLSYPNSITHPECGRSSKSPFPAMSASKLE